MDERHKVLVVFAPAKGQLREYALALPTHGTVRDALYACPLGRDEQVQQLLQAHPDCVSVWGRRAHPEQTLCDGDRVEICRPLRADPKLARRLRYAAARRR